MEPQNHSPKVLSLVLTKTIPVDTYTIIIDIPGQQADEPRLPFAEFLSRLVTKRQLRKLKKAFVYGITSYLVVEIIWHLGELLSAQVLISILLFRGGFPEHVPSSCAFVCMTLGKLLKTHKMSAIQERGPEILTFESVKERAEDYLDASRIKGEKDPGLSWGRLRLPSEIGTGHFLLVGTAGSGKTLLMDHLLFSVLRRMGRGEGKRALIFDYKGNAFEKAKAMTRATAPSTPVFILNPYHPEAVAWDMAADIDSDQAAMSLAIALIPPEQSTSPYYTNAARTLVLSVLKSFIRVAPKEWTLRDLLIACENVENMRAVIDLCDDARRDAHNIFQEVQTLPGVVSSVTSKVSPVRTIAALWAPLIRANKKISIAQWHASESVLILSYVPKLKQQLAAINQTIINWTTIVVLSRPDISHKRKGEEQTWIFFDELREIGLLPTLSSYLNAGRSKGACVCMGIQSIEGMRQVYGNDQTEEITGQCKYVTMLNCSSQTAEWGQHFFQKIQFMTAGRPGQGQRSETPRVSSSTLKNIPPANDKNGVLAYHGVSGIGIYATHSKMTTLASGLPDYEATPVKSDDPIDWGGMDPEKPTLYPWSDDDYRRLKMKPVASKPSESPQSADAPTAEQTRVAPEGPVEEGKQPPGADFLFKD